MRLRSFLKSFVLSKKKIELINFSYTVDDCYAERMQNITFAECNCLSQNFDVPERFCKIDKSKAPQHCTESQEGSLCEFVIRKKIFQNFIELVSSHCPTPCTMLKYNKFVSSSNWPSHMAENKVLQLIRDAHVKIESQNLISTLDEIYNSSDEEIDGLNLIRDNFLKLVIYADSIRGNEVKEEEAYPIQNFLGEVGGILGLWLGGSVLTFFEPMELLMNLILLAIFGCDLPIQDFPDMNSRKTSIDSSLLALEMQRKSSIHSRKTSHLFSAAANLQKLAEIQSRKRSVANKELFSAPPYENALSSVNTQQSLKKTLSFADQRIVNLELCPKENPIDSRIRDLENPKVSIEQTASPPPPELRRKNTEEIRKSQHDYWKNDSEIGSIEYQEEEYFSLR